MPLPTKTKFVNRTLMRALSILIRDLLAGNLNKHQVRWLAIWHPEYDFKQGYDDDHLVRMAHVTIERALFLRNDMDCIRGMAMRHWISRKNHLTNRKICPT